MGNERTKRINIAALVIVMLMIFVTLLIKKQTVTYDLVGNIDSSISLGAGENVLQTYSPNRRAITKFVFKLQEETELNGTYTLVVTEKDTLKEEYKYCITNVYDGECVDALEFVLPEKYDPRPSVRLNLFLKSDVGNSEGVDLASSSAFRSATYYDEQTEKTVLSDSTLALSVVSEKSYKWFLLMNILLLTFGVTFLLMHFFNNNFEDNIALSVFLSVFFTYLLGIIGLLKFAPAFLFVISLIGIVLFFADCNKKGLLFYKCMHGGMIMWIVVVVVILISIQHNIIGDADTVFYINKCRYMFWTNELAYSHGYGFFVPVLAYLFETINGVFTEDLFLISIKIYEFSLLFTFINLVKTKDSSKNSILQFVILDLCTVLAIAILPNAYFTAMMDIPFAITLVYVIEQIYMRELTKESFLKIICSSLALTMIKRSGLPVVIIIAIILVVHSFRFNKTVKRYDRRYILSALMILIICIIVGKVIDIRGDHTADEVTEYSRDYIYEPPAIVESEQENESITDTQQIQTVSNQTINENQGGLSWIEKIKQALDIRIIGMLCYTFFAIEVFIGLSYAETLGIIFLIGAVTWLVRKDEYSLEFFKDVTELTFAAFLYFGAIAYKYLFVIEEYNKYNLNAYDRYAIHFIGAVTIYELIYLIKVVNKKTDEHYSDFRMILFAVVVFVMACLKTDFVEITNNMDSDVVEIEKKTDGLERVLATYYGMGHHITVYTSDSTFDQLAYYVKRINLENWGTMASFNISNISSEEVSDDYERYLYSDAEYLYLINYDTDFLKYCPDLFENKEQDIKRHALYHVEKNQDGTVMLVYLGQIPLEDNILRTPDGKERLGG